jgi:hypothetical protein
VWVVVVVVAVVVVVVDSMGGCVKVRSKAVA